MQSTDIKTISIKHKNSFTSKDLDYIDPCWNEICMSAVGDDIDDNVSEACHPTLDISRLVTIWKFPKSMVFTNYLTPIGNLFKTRNDCNYI